MTKIILIVTLLFLAGCNKDSPGWLMHEAIDKCKTNGGVKYFKTWSDSGAMSFSCENGAKFYLRADEDIQK